MNTPAIRDNVSPGKLPIFLAVSRQSVTRDLLAAILKNNGFAVEAVGTPGEAAERLVAGRFTAALVDMRAQALESRETPSRLRAADSRVRLVILADEDDSEIAEGAARVQAHAVLTRPFEDDAIIRTLRAILESLEGAS